MAGPVPDAPAVIVSHPALLAAVQAQLAPAERVVLPVPPAAVNESLVGETEYAQLPDCVTLNVAPAIVSEPERVVVAVFAVTLNATLPGPVPVAPLVTVIQAALLAAVHAQSAPVVTVLLPVSGAEANA